MKQYNIVVLRGDGIGPEIVAEAVKVLDAAGEKFGFRFAYDEQLMGGCAIDATGEPLPQQTVEACKKADSVLLGAVGGWKWDTLPGSQRRRRDCSASAARWGCMRTCGLLKF